jgi:hypothetical protein
VGARASRLRGCRRVLRVAVVFAVGFFGVVSVAQAGWSPAARVLGEGRFGDATVAFDAQNMPWVAWAVNPERGVASPGLFVARLTGDYRLASVQRVSAPSSEEMEQLVFGIDSAGFGVLTWRGLTGYRPGRTEDAAVTSWRLGGALTKPVELSTPSANEVGPVSLATNLHGTSVVMYSEAESPHAEGAVPTSRIAAARLSAGNVLARQTVGTISGDTLINARVAAGTAERFQATWGLEGGASEQYAALGSDTAQANASGVFSAAQLTAWPAGFKRETLGRQQLISDPRGDQVVWWTTGQESATVPQDLYVATRRVGQPFDAPQLIGQTEYATPSPEVVINGVGRVTVAWTQPRGDKRTAVLAATGQAGGKLRTPRPLSTASRLGGLELVLTQAGEVVAAWWQELASGEVIAQAATSPAGAGFARPQMVFRTKAHAGLSCGGPSLWPDRRNGVLAGWTCNAAGNGQHEVEEFAHYQP